MPRNFIRDASYSIKSPGTSGGCITIPNSASLNPTAAMSGEAWVYLRSYGNGVIIFDNTNGGVAASMDIHINTLGGLQWFCRINGIDRVIVNTAVKIPLHRWIHVAGTYTGSRIDLFIQGVQLAETLTGLSGDLGTNPSVFRIGQYFSGNAYTLDGYIYRPRVYNRAVTASEMYDRCFYNRDDATINTGLVLDLKMLAGSGGTVLDYSGSNNNGTLQSGAAWSTQIPFANRIGSTSRVAMSGRVPQSGRIAIT